MKHSIPYLKFKRKKLGMLCFWILVALYLSFIFEGFLAPYQPNTKFKSKHHASGEPDDIEEMPF